MLERLPVAPKPVGDEKRVPRRLRHFEGMEARANGAHVAGGLEHGLQKPWQLLLHGSREALRELQDAVLLLHARLATLCEKQHFKRLEARGWRSHEHGVDPIGQGYVRLALLQTGAGAGLVQPLDRQRRNRPALRQHAVGGAAFGQVEPPTKRRAGAIRAAMRVEHSLQPSALRLGRNEQLVERVLLTAVDDGGQTFGAPRQHLRAQVGHERVALRVVDHAKAARDVRFQRKAVQHGFAEGVDRLDLQAARRIERMGEELPRPARGRLVGNVARHLAKLRRERLVPQRRPSRQPAVHAVGHLRGSGLGVGEAEDLGRGNAREKQPDHTQRQDVRLARARVGRDPGGMARVRRAALARGRVVDRRPVRLERPSQRSVRLLAKWPRTDELRGRQAPVHASSSSSSSSSPTIHSRARAR